MDANEITPGMKVEAKGELGEQDVSPAKVTGVKKNQEGDIEAIEVTKGALFRKKLEVPTDRLQAVNPADNGATIKIDANESELEGLTARGAQSLPHESEKPQDDLLDQV